jgi:hypothetical protein
MFAQLRVPDEAELFKDELEPLLLSTLRLLSEMPSTLGGTDVAVIPFC